MTISEQATPGSDRRRRWWSLWAGCFWLGTVVGAAGGAAGQDPVAPAAQDSSALADSAEGYWLVPQSQLDVDLSPAERIDALNSRILKEPRNGDLYNDLGVIYAQQQDWLLARDAFISAVQCKPTEADFHRNLGQVFVNLREFDLAAREFEAYRKFDALGSRDVYRLLGEARRKAGDASQAAEIFGEGLAALAGDFGLENMRLILSLVGLQTEQGESAEARTTLEKYLLPVQNYIRAAEARGDDEGLLTAQAIVNNLLAGYLEDAQILADSDLPEEAAELYTKAYELSPAHDEILPRIVGMYLAADNALKARVTARLARMDHPTAPGTWIATGKIAEHANRLEDAVEAYLKAKELQPESRELDLVLGSLYMKLGDGARAQRYMARGISSPDAPPELVYNYAVSLLKEEKYQLAISPLQRAVRENPEMTQAWQALALSLRMSKRYQEAIPAYQKALSLAPDAKLAFNLGYCFSRIEKVEESVAAYRQAIALDPAFKEAYYNLGRTLMEAQRYEDALAVLAQHLEIEPDSYRLHFNQGLCLYRLGRYQQAIDSYDRALEEDETADVYNNMGLAFAKLGDKKQADLCYRQAKRLQGGG